MRRQLGVALLSALALHLVTAGCAGGPTGAGTATDANTATEPPPTTPDRSGDIDFPDGPKAPPERPSTLNESSVREYAWTYEYRYAYNSLWISEHTDVTPDCRVDDVTRGAKGYGAVVTCTGYSNTRVPENATGTPGPHADWFTQTYRYREREGATQRFEAANRDPVS